MKKSALILIDLIHEIIHPSGKLAAKGYSDYVARHNSDSHVAAHLSEARNEGQLIVHVRLQFDTHYQDCPSGSPLFGAASKFGILKENSPSTDFVEFANPTSREIILTKKRVSAFFGTHLELLLRNQGVTAVFLMGCATDLAIEAAARDAHDRDFDVTILEKGCIAATDEDHDRALATLRKIASIL